MPTFGFKNTPPRPVARVTRPYPSVIVKQSGLNTGVKKGARTGWRRVIVRAGEGLFVTRDYKRSEPIIDYRFKDGHSGARVDHLYAGELEARYPKTAGMPHGSGTHVLQPWGSKYAYDTARSGGVGGKANTNKGNQSAYFGGSIIFAHRTKPLLAGDEVFVSYSQGNSYKFGDDRVSDSRSGWGWGRWLAVSTR